MISLLILLTIDSIVNGEISSNVGRKSWKWPDENNVKFIENNPSPFFHILKHKFKIQVIEKIPTTPVPPGDCICVPYYQCNSNNTIITDGIGIIDVRIRRCTGDLEVCCKLLNFIPQPPPSSMAPIIIPTTNPTTNSPSTTTSTTAAASSSTTSFPATSPSTLSPISSSTPPPVTSVPSYNCICVDRSLCNSNGFVIVAGEGIINPRQTQYPCPLSNQICCRLPTNSIYFPSSSIAPTTTTTTTTTSTTPPPPPTTTITTTTTTTTTAAPPIITSTVVAVESQQNSCICVKILQCNVNNLVIISGGGILNPRNPNYRQGQTIVNCQSDEICCHLQPPRPFSATEITAISFPSPTSIAAKPDGIYPRANISINEFTPGVIKNPGTAMACICVKSWSCSISNIIILDPAGIIDSRFSYCMMADEVCCRTQGISNIMQTILPGSNVLVIQNGVAASSSDTQSADCGIPGRKCLPGECSTDIGETYFAEFPWMVAIILRQNSGSGLFLCGGSMINNRAVLTAAHCVLNRERGLLVARFGEWNTANNDELLPYQESAVQAIVTHPNYYKDGLYHDVAVLILSTPVGNAINIQPICLPKQGMIFTSGTRCVASGWGRSGFDGEYQTTLKKIDLPLVGMSECQKRLRSTRLGEYFQLHRSFLCAGGEANKDTCTGDGGGPLVCSTASGQYIQVGIVSWGIGCGEGDVPAVYADVAQHRQWIDQQLANYGVS